MSTSIWPTLRSQALDEFCGKHVARMALFVAADCAGWQPVVVGVASAARNRVARVVCIHSLAAACEDRHPSRPAPLWCNLSGRPRILVGFDLLAVLATSDLEPRLVCALGLSCDL